MIYEFYINDNWSLEFKITNKNIIYYSLIKEGSNYSNVYRSENSLYDVEYNKSLNKQIGIIKSEVVIPQEVIKRRFSEGYKNAIKEINSFLRTKYQK